MFTSTDYDPGAQTLDTIALKYLDATPGHHPTAVRFAVPWPRGICRKVDRPALRAGNGRPITFQSWPLAWWPDGSVKWTAFAAALDAEHGEHFTVERHVPASHVSALLTAHEVEDSIDIEHGDLAVSCGRSGHSLVREVRRGNVVVARNLRLIAIHEHRARIGDEDRVTRRRFIGVIEEATVERSGPVSAVVRLKGRHRLPDGEDAWLPFIVRIFICAGVEPIRLVHSFVYDGDANVDFVAAVGIEAAIPLRGAPWNRRIFLGLDGPGVFSEPVCPLPIMTERDDAQGGAKLEPNPERLRQFAGESLVQPGGAAATPVWHHFDLRQDSADHFVVHKGCGDRFTRIEATHGRRAAGAIAITDGHDGFGFGMRDFWQTHPSALAVDDAGEATARITAWLWPTPDDAPAMDLRHYTDRIHGPMYEAYQCLNWEAGPADPERSNALGIARTHELMLWPITGSTGREDIAERARTSATPPLLVCSPEHYRDSGACGIWALLDRSHPSAHALDMQAEAMLDHYVAEVERQRWYGFWHYGDVMHSFDPLRRRWCCDEGGYAWDNIECSTDIWLWVSFFRTGRADLFRMAEAMARHVSDVDVHHLGPFAGLGSRHNVTHWGCACKEPRISMPGGRRYCHYLTVDERLADVFDEVCDAWPADRCEMVTAPTWSALCWNWVTAWERTGDARYRDKLLRGMNDILAHHPPFISGPTCDFDPADASLTRHDPQPPYSYHMTLPFGSPEIFFEMAELMDHEPWAEALAGYGRFWALPAEERLRLVSFGFVEHRSEFSARMIAFASRRDGDPGLADEAWRVLLDDLLNLETAVQPDTGREIQVIAMSECRGHTNRAAQRGLQIAELLALVGPPSDAIVKGGA
ncbi:MAG: hypothetical protein CMJ18_14650 [Phycisphaeraceae bacterium]|nr:hypothetical protein [Phycisphaeraceae bacterium]